MDYIRDISTYFDRLKSTLDSIDKSELNTIMNVLERAREEGRHVFVMGNGGSGATASHYVCDFNKGISMNQSKKYKFICLNDNVPSIMAYANDISYNEIFVGQLRNLFEEGDVAIGISGSGNSENVINAIEFVNKNNGITIGLSGYDGGKLKQIVQYGVHIPIDDMQITEDLHMVLDHCMMKILAY